MPGSSASLLAAVARASRDRLVRFLRFVDRGRPAWAGDPATWSDMELRSAAFVAADRIRAKRRIDAEWRRHDARHANVLRHGIPAGHTAFPSYTGPALDVWLSQAEEAAFPFAQAAE